MIERQDPCYHWIEDGKEIVLFTGTEQEVSGYYRQHGGSNAGLHLIHSRIIQGGERLSPPVVGKVVP